MNGFSIQPVGCLVVSSFISFGTVAVTTIRLVRSISLDTKMLFRQFYVVQLVYSQTANSNRRSTLLSALAFCAVYQSFQHLVEFRSDDTKTMQAPQVRSPTSEYSR